METRQSKVLNNMGVEKEDDYKEKNTKPIVAKSSNREEVKNNKLKKRDKQEPKKEAKEEPKKKKPTRADVFKQLMKKGGTKEELTKRMIAKYGGSENEAEFQVVTFIRLLLTMGYATKDEKGKITLK